MEMRVGAAPIFVQFGRAIAVGLLLLFAAFNASALAQDGPKAAAAAKEAAANMQAYLRDLEKTGGQPDYSNPPASEYLKRIFDADALAALPEPKAADFDWIGEWFVSVDHTYRAIVKFGTTDKTKTESEIITHNLQRHEAPISTAWSFLLRVNARLASTAPLYIDSLPPNQPNQRTETRKKGLRQINRMLMQMATGAAMMITPPVEMQIATGTAMMINGPLNPQNRRLLAATLRDTVPVWAPIATPKERATILAALEKARAANKDAGIDDDITAVTTALKNVKE